MEYYRNPQAATPGLLVRDVGLLLLRLGVSVVLGACHAWQQILLGWGHLWRKESWPFVDALQRWGIPFPHIAASIASVIFVLCSVGLFLGAVSRLSALLLLLCTLSALAFNAAEPLAEKLVLYAIIYLVILLCGPGCFSVDHLLRNRRK
ncbi:MAG: DoxX family membrane protein [Verrucomicrobiales bacterium]|nr:DoxX family membrane protein [Verrucomicrobiales bacterium]